MSLPETRSLRLISRVALAEGIVGLEFRDPSGGDLAAWTAGAHVDLHLPSGRARKYSLCGSPGDRGSYRVAVLRAGEGGCSAEIHDRLAPGDLLAVSEPMNHFPMIEAERYVFIAGGIGITPFLPMIEEVELRGRSWTLAYGGRSLATMPFIDRFASANSNVHLYPRDSSGRIDMEATIAAAPKEAAIYCCGPARMMESALKIAERQGRVDRLHLERFGTGGEIIEATGDTAFEVHLARCGITLTVGPEETLGQVLQDAYAPVALSCTQGYCGSCRTRVIEGAPDHRDIFLTDAERAGGEMMVCCGRSLTTRLVLDI